MIETDSLFSGDSIVAVTHSSGVLFQHLPEPRFLFVNGTVLHIIPDFPEIEDNTLNLGFKLRTVDGPNPITIEMMLRNHTSDITASITIDGKRKLTIDPEYGGPNFDFYAQTTITTREMSLLFSVDQNETSIYLDGYLVAKTSKGLSSTTGLLAPRVRILVSRSEVLYLNSIVTYLGEPQLNWSTRPSRYRVTRSDVDEHKLLSEMADGYLHVDKDEPFEPYNPLTLMYGKGSLESRMEEPRTFNRLLSERTPLVKGDVMHTKVVLGEDRPSREYLIFK